MGTYNKDQWIDSFEGQMAIVRPHLTGRILTAVSLGAWHSRGTKGEDPIEAARAEAARLDGKQETPSAGNPRSTKGRPK